MELAERAVNWYRLQPEQPANPVNWVNNQARALYLAGRGEEARRRYRTLLEDPDRAVFALGHLGALAVQMDELEEARQIDAQLRAADGIHPGAGHVLACLDGGVAR